MYIGIGPEKGKRIMEEDAFGYAMDRCSTDCVNDFLKEFGCVILQNRRGIYDFREDLVKWFYSGNWVRREENG